ncbi:MAG: hypothetical protein ACTSQY_06745 [Candidatus Odinarchaeia archaeon]
MVLYKVYLKKSGQTAGIDKLWDVIQIEANTEKEKQKELDKLSKKGWKIFKVSEVT